MRIELWSTRFVYMGVELGLSLREENYVDVRALAVMVMMG
jgi:hypothetical protein